MIMIVGTSAFSGLSKLKILYASRDDSIDNLLTSCINSDLNYNDINTINSGAFKGLTSLAALGLAYNKFTSLPSGIFSGLSSIEVMYIYRGHLGVN